MLVIKGKNKYFDYIKYTKTLLTIKYPYYIYIFYLNKFVYFNKVNIENSIRLFL